jgi:hypothetical protein
MSDLVHSPPQVLAPPRVVQEEAENLAGQGYKIDRIYSGICQEGKGAGLQGWCIEFSDNLQYRRAKWQVWLFDFDPLGDAVKVDCEVV